MWQFLKDPGVYTKPTAPLTPIVTEVLVPGLGLTRPVSIYIALKIKGIADWDMSFLLHRSPLSQMPQQQFDQGILEVKKYHAIGVIDPTYIHAVSAPVDPFWHEHLHFSQDYQAFSERFFGHYKDHFPIDESIPGVQEQIMPFYARTLQIYDEYFGAHSAQWWPAGAPVCTDAGDHTPTKYMNGWHQPLDWEKIVASTKPYDELYDELEQGTFA